MEEVSIGIIGAGAMGGALAQGLIRAGVRPGHILVSDVDEARLADLSGRLGVQARQDNRAVAAAVDALVLAVKPQTMPGVAREVAAALPPGRLVVSIAAGVTLASLEEWLGQGRPVVRAMPNNPCLVGKGVSALAPGRWVEEQHLELAQGILGAVGVTRQVPEKWLDAVTALSGSGPAYVYLFLEALVDAGVRVGLPRDLALTLAVQTTAGAAAMVQETGLHTAQLKDAVTSPGGTTAAGLAVLEEAGLRGTVIRAVEAAWQRSRELSRAQE